MSDRTTIEWTRSDDGSPGATWNPVTGCTKVSPGCDHCYAERITNRFGGPGAFDTVTLHPDRLSKPLHWRKPRRVFVNSMSDLFHKDVPDEFIVRVWAVMALAPQHTFQVLTKRHGRMRSLLRNPAFRVLVKMKARDMKYGDGQSDPRMDDRNYQTWPLPNMWLGVSVEDQQRADLRIPALLDTPAAVRFLSCEPLLGPVCLDPWRTPHGTSTTPCGGGPPHGLHWVIVGGESGPGARPMHPEWARSLRDQCVTAGVPFHFKQWGEWAPAGYQDGTHLVQTTGKVVTRASGTVKNPYGHGSGTQDLVDRGHLGWVRMRRVGKHRAGRMLDGRTWDECPAVVTA